MSEQITEEGLQNELNELFHDKTVYQGTEYKYDPKIKKTKLVLSGGGTKGIAHLGALQALQELGLLQHIDTYAGTSVGAFIAAFLVIGYSPTHMFEIISGIDLHKMKNRIKFDNILKLFGLDDGTGMVTIIEKMFKAKNISPDVTFAQLYEKTKKTLIVTATCLNDKKVYYYSHTTFPDMQVILAVRMSISLPIYFVPVKYKNKLFIDGGCIDNYPIQLFNKCLDEVIGIYLGDIRDYTKDIANIEDVLLNTIQCLLEGATCNALKGFERYSIKISLKNISVVDLQLDQETKQKLFDTGYNTILQFLNVNR